MNSSVIFSFPVEEAQSEDLDMKQMKEMASNEHSFTMAAVCGLIALLSFVGNPLLCVVILRRRSMLAKPYNVLIFNLAVTDMLTGKIFFVSFIPFIYTYYMQQPCPTIHNN